MLRTLKARVANGRLVVDEPTTLPEGTELNLIIAEDWDELDDDERNRLEAALAEGWASLRADDRIAADDVLAELDRA